MGIENSKITYSGEGEHFDKYLPGLKRVSEKTQWKSGLLVYFDNLDPLITILVSSEHTPSISREKYTHIFTAKHEDGSVNVIYLMKVTAEEAEEYKKIKEPPKAPALPNFKYNVGEKYAKKKTSSTEQSTADKIVSESGPGDSSYDILSAIIKAQNIVGSADGEAVTNSETVVGGDKRDDVVKA